MGEDFAINHQHSVGYIEMYLLDFLPRSLIVPML